MQRHVKSKKMRRVMGSLNMNSILQEVINLPRLTEDNFLRENYSAHLLQRRYKVDWTRAHTVLTGAIMWCPAVEVNPDNKSLEKFVCIMLISGKWFMIPKAFFKKKEFKRVANLDESPLED